MKVEDTIKYLKILLDDYKLNPETLARYLLIKINDVYAISNGNLSVLDSTQAQYNLVHKIYELYAIVQNDADMKVKTYLEVLINYYGITKLTFSLMAKVEMAEIEKFLKFPQSVDPAIKYDIAATVMSLRHLLTK